MPPISRRLLLQGTIAGLLAAQGARGQTMLGMGPAASRGKVPAPSQGVYQYLSLSEPSVVEGDSGTTVLRFVLSRAADGQPPIAWSAATTANGTATPDVDFESFSDSGTIAAGQSVNLDVNAIGDEIEEDNETVEMQVTASWAAS